MVLFGDGTLVQMVIFGEQIPGRKSSLNRATFSGSTLCLKTITLMSSNKYND